MFVGSISKRAHRSTLTLFGALALLAPATAVAQAPGTPVLQDAFLNPGLAVAANFGGGGGQSFFGAAAGYGLGSGRIQASAAAGVQRSNEAKRGSYGARVAANLWTSASGALGAALFGGIGGATRTRDEAGLTTNPAVIAVPVGASVAYRRAIGKTRGVAAYVSPLYRWTRAETDLLKTSTGSFGGAVGVDFAISPSIGFTLGAEFGKSGGSAGKSSSIIGGAVSFVPGR